MLKFIWSGKGQEQSEPMKKYKIGELIQMHNQYSLLKYTDVEYCDKLLSRSGKCEWKRDPHTHGSLICDKDNSKCLYIKKGVAINYITIYIYNLFLYVRKMYNWNFPSYHSNT